MSPYKCIYEGYFKELLFSSRFVLDSMALVNKFNVVELLQNDGLFYFEGLYIF